jgi:uncharacterized protein (TIGR02118 family)
MLSGDDTMLKFMVVLVRKAGMDRLEFKRYFKDVHQPLARRIAGLRRYVQNFAVDDPHRKPPAWDAIIELYFDNWERMEAAWATPEGKASTEDLAAFADIGRSTWSVVDEDTIF